MLSPIMLPEQPESTTGHNPLAVFVPVSSIFPDCVADPANLKEILSTISRTDGLIWAARLNLVLSNPLNHDHIAKQGYAIQNFFSPEEISRIDAFISESNRDAKNVFVFFRPQLLDLILWICKYSTDHQNDGRTFDAPEARRSFAQAALIAGELWGQRVYGSKLAGTDGIDAARRRGLGAFRAAAQVSGGMPPQLAVARGWGLFIDHLPQHWHEFSGAFNSQAGLSIETYFGLLMNIAVHYLDCTPEKAIKEKRNGIMRFSHSEEKDVQLASDFNSLCESASLTSSQLTQSLWAAEEESSDGPNEITWDKLKILRTHPILRTLDGRAIVLDPIYFSESASAGPLFRTIPADDKGRKLAFAAFGLAFESYAHAILQRMYPISSGGLVNILSLNPMGRNAKNQQVELADACLNYATDIVLIEAKAKWLNDAACDNGDPETYLSHLRDKYVRSTNGNEQAVAQMASVIKQLEDGRYRPISSDFATATRIIPVLLAHDSNLDAPLHPYFLANDFQDELKPDEVYADGSMRIGRLKVAALTILTIDDLEYLERSIDKFSFLDVLKDYAHAHPGRFVSFRNFLTTSSYRDKLLACSSLAESALNAIHIAKGALGALPPNTT